MSLFFVTGKNADGEDLDLFVEALDHDAALTHWIQYYDLDVIEIERVEDLDDVTINVWEIPAKRAAGPLMWDHLALKAYLVTEED